MEEFTFRGLDKKANIMGGVIIALIIIIVTTIGFILLRSKINTFFSAVFFILSHGFVAVAIYQIFIVRHLNKKWKIIAYDTYVELFFNNKHFKK